MLKLRFLQASKGPRATRNGITGCQLICSLAAVLTPSPYCHGSLCSANENHLRNEVALLARELQAKDETIKKLDSLIEKLQEDATTKRQALDARVRTFPLGSRICAETSCEATLYENSALSRASVMLTSKVTLKTDTNTCPLLLCNGICSPPRM